MMSESFSRKNNKRKTWNLWIVTVIWLIVLAAISTGIYFLQSSMADNEDIGCSTKSCLETALEIMSSLDVTMNPCEDFYQFACGNFINKADESNTQSSYFAQHVRSIYKLNSIITEPIRGNERKAVLLQKNFYQACMNVMKIDEDENKTFKELLGKLGGWPVIDGQKWSDDTFHLNEIITKCKDLGLPFQWFFQFSFDENLYEIHINIPTIIQKIDYLKDFTYLNLMVETAVQFGSSKIIATNEMTKVIMFEKKLENIILRNSQNGLIFMNISTMDSVFPRFSWLQFTDNLMKNFNFTQTENYLINSDATYFRELNSLFAKTPNRTQANYIIWKVIQEFGLYLSTPIRENFADYRNYVKLHDKPYQNTRVEWCLEDARIRFPGVAETEFVYRYINEDKYRNIMKMIADIKEQFVKYLKSVSWINVGTKEVAINKIKSIVEVIGLEVLDFNDDVLEDFLDIDDLEFTTPNIINMIREKNLNDFKRLLSENPFPENDISNTFWSYEIHSTYKHIPNILFLSAEIIQDHFYNGDRPNFLNYGALGSIIGRKIAQGFGKYVYSLNEEKAIIMALYNESVYRINGIKSLNMTELLNNNTFEMVDSDQGAGKIIEEINDKKTMMENFINFIGIDIVYSAYIKWIEENHEENKLPYLPYTALQMFWIEYGRINCYKKIDGINWPSTENTPDSARYRVINSVQHSKNFAKDFECQEDTPMNPFLVL